MASSFFRQKKPKRKPKPKSQACLYPFDKPTKSLYFRSFAVCVLLVRFHFKVRRKSL